MKRTNGKINAIEKTKGPESNVTIKHIQVGTGAN